jgi:hypothetical protein
VEGGEGPGKGHRPIDPHDPVTPRPGDLNDRCVRHRAQLRPHVFLGREALRVEAQSQLELMPRVGVVDEVEIRRDTVGRLEEADPEDRLLRAQERQGPLVEAHEVGLVRDVPEDGDPGPLQPASQGDLRLGIGGLDDEQVALAPRERLPHLGRGERGEIRLPKRLPAG